MGISASYFSEQLSFIQLGFKRFILAITGTYWHLETYGVDMEALNEEKKRWTSFFRIDDQRK